MLTAMESPHIALVATDPDARLEMARAFDTAPARWRVSLHHEAPSNADLVVVGPGTRAKGLRFDPHRPLEAVSEELARRSPGRSRTVIVTGASGGVGVTTLALHLAAAFAENSPTLLFEFDAGSGTAERLALDSPLTWDEDDSGVSPRPTVPIAAGFSALFSPDEAAGAVRAKALGEIAREFDRIVVDAALGAAGSFVEHAAACVLVVAPTAPGAQRAKRLLGDHPEATWAVVTNRLGPGGELTQSRLERLLGRRIALELPCCAALRDAEDDGRVVRSRLRRYVRAVHRIAKTLETGW
jgi:Flp pilus assembly CpaE family ATPase